MVKVEAKSKAEQGPTNGRAMIRSLIAQLLHQRSFDLFLLSEEIDLESVRKRELGIICTLFHWLVHRIPQDLTLVCIIDGISHYENDDFEDDMLKVLRLMLSLSRDDNSGSVVKILSTSPTTTDSVQEEFKGDYECFVSMTELPVTGPQFGMLEIQSGLGVGREDSEGSKDGSGESD